MKMQKRIYQQPLTVEDEGTFQVGSRYSEGISASQSLSLGPPSAGGAAPLLGDATHRECQQREREERCSVFPVPGRLSRLLPSQQRGWNRQRDRGSAEGGGVWWSLERTNERTPHHVSARRASSGGGRQGRKEGRSSQAALPCTVGARRYVQYWVRLKGSYVVERIFFLLLLNCSAWPCLGPA